MKLQKHASADPMHLKHRALGMKQRSRHLAPKRSRPIRSSTVEQVFTHEEPVRSMLQQIVARAEVDVQLPSHGQIAEINPSTKFALYDCSVDFVGQVLVRDEWVQIMPLVRSPRVS